MANDEPRGAVYWIDHFVVGTNDMVAWVNWAVKATGVQRSPILGITTAARKKNAPIQCFLFFSGGSCRIGAFLQSEIYPYQRCRNGALRKDLKAMEALTNHPFL